MADNKPAEKKKKSGSIWILVLIIFLGSTIVSLAMSGLNNIIYALSSGMASSSQGMKELLRSSIRFFLMLGLIILVGKLFVDGIKSLFKKKETTTPSP